MEKKSVSATILVLFLALFFSVVGSCFSFFVYKYSRTIVESVGVVSDSEIEVFLDEKLKKKIDKLKLSDMELGLKPATGEVDAESQVPSTIVDDGTSEGYYSTVYVKSAGNFRISLSNIQIKSDHDKELVNEERKNIFIGINSIFHITDTLYLSFAENTLFRQIKQLELEGSAANIAYKNFHIKPPFFQIQTQHRPCQLLQLRDKKI